MSLELSKISDQVGQMGQALADRQRRHDEQVQQARQVLKENAVVTEALRRKIGTACRSDESWRGADPADECLDRRVRPASLRQPATLLAADGSQIYPNRHDIAPFFLVNIGSIVLRQGSGQAPDVATRPTIYFEDGDLYDDGGHLHQPEHVDALRARQELDMLVELAEAERDALGGDLTRPIFALADGPLLPWQSQRQRTRVNEPASDPHLGHFIARLERLCALHVVPIGYVDRPSSANLLRTLELTALPLERVDRQTVRHGPYRSLTDRLLLADLAPNQRTGLFASTTALNKQLSRASGNGPGYQVVFFYLNVAREPDEDRGRRAIIARVDLPAWDWLVNDQEKLDNLQQALYADCDLTRYPYTLARAHELAVVANLDRANLEHMLQQSMWRCGVPPMTSYKEAAKQWTRRRRRR